MASSPFYLPPPVSSSHGPRTSDVSSAFFEPIPPTSPATFNTPSRRNITEYPLTTHLAFLGGLTALILPISLIPYLLTKRKVSSLQRTVSALESQLSGVTTQMQTALPEIHKLQMGAKADALASVKTSATTETAYKRVVQLADDMKAVEQQVTEVKGVVENRERRAKITQSELQYLLEEAKIARTHGDAVRSLGISLADIAAFMHQVELWMPLMELEGTNKMRVEELRMIALKLQNLPRGNQRTKTALEKLAELR